MSQTRRCGPRTTDGERFESFSKLFSTTEAQRDQRRQRQTETETRSEETRRKTQKRNSPVWFIFKIMRKKHTTFEKAFES